VASESSLVCMRSLERREPSFVDTRLHDHLDKQCGTIRMMSWSCPLKPRPAANVRGDASCKVAVPSSSPSRRLQEGHLRGRAAATLPHSKTACSLRQDSLLASLDPSFSHKSSEHNARANLHASRLREHHAADEPLSMRATSCPSAGCRRAGPPCPSWPPASEGSAACAPGWRPG
jgi:hypothetical protein